MERHDQLKDIDFEKQFENCTFDPKLFTHEAHLRLAWIHVKKYGVENAITNLCNQISKFDRTFGDGTKFNTTVTIASAKVVNHFIQKKPTLSSFNEFINEFPRLKFNFKEILGFHYGIDIFREENAKHKFLKPDLLAFE